MKTIISILASILLISCNTQVQDTKENIEPTIIYREKKNTTLIDIALDLLKFGKYDMALELIDGDTSYEANNIRARVFEAEENFRDAMRLDIMSLRQYDGQEFFEGSWILCELYELCLKETEYAKSVLESEISEFPSNYQPRLLLMKLLWAQGENLEEVVRMGDRFRKELPDMSHEVAFNFWRQDALDTLSVKSPDTYNKILASYRPGPWNGVEIKND